MVSGTQVGIGTTGPDLDRIAGQAASAGRELAESTPDQRARWLQAIAGALDAAENDLVPVAAEETSLGDGRLRGELSRTTGQLGLFAEVALEGSFLEVTIDHARPDTTPPQPDLRRMLGPIGPVAVFSAGNFPFAFSVAGGDTASALAAGCPVVVKAHPGHPRLSERTAQIVLDALRSAGAPEGTFAMVEGYDIGQDLVAHPSIKAVGFTGSLAGGRALFDLATGRPDPIPFYGELGSINPVVITRGAALERTTEVATGLVDSFTLGVGQFCTKPGVVLLPEGTPLEEAIITAVGGASGGRMLSTRMADGFRAGLASMVGSGRVEVLAGDTERTAGDADVTPIVLATSADDVRAAADVLLEECFGPVTLLVRYGEGQLDRALDELPGSLTATIHATEDEVPDLSPTLRRLSDLAGRVIFGGWPTGVAVGWAQHHGGPWPATTAPLHTSVGATAVQRFLRPVVYQDVPPGLLPEALRDDNPLNVPRRIDGELKLNSTPG